jgi:adenylate cyclase
MGETRKLAAILVADVVGYSRLAAADEDRTLARLRGLRSDLVDPAVAVITGVSSRARATGLSPSSSAWSTRWVALSRCRMAWPRAAPACRPSAVSSFESAFISATSSRSRTAGVNIDMRLEGTAKPNAICLSERAYWQVKGRLDLAVRDLGPTQLKNIAEPIRVYSFEVGQPARAKSAPLTAAQKSATPRLSIVVLSVSIVRRRDVAGRLG